MANSYMTPYGVRVSEEERTKMIQAAIGEASSEGAVGMQAVANVIMNRAIDGNYGKTIKSIITPDQFSYLKDKNAKRADSEMARKTKVARTAESIIDSVLNGTASDVTNGAVGYHAKGAKMSSWQRRGIASGPTKIGGHLFYNADPKSKARVQAAYDVSPQPTQASMFEQRSGLLESLFGADPAKSAMEGPTLAAAMAGPPKDDPLSSIKAQMAATSLAAPAAVRAKYDPLSPTTKPTPAKYDPLSSIKAQMATSSLAAPPSAIARHAQAATQDALAGKPLTPERANLAAIGEKLAGVPGAPAMAGALTPRPDMPASTGYPLSSVRAPTAASQELSAPSSEMLSRQAELAGLGAPSITGMPGNPPSFGEPVMGGTARPVGPGASVAMKPSAPTLTKMVPTTTISVPSQPAAPKTAAPAPADIGAGTIAHPMAGATGPLAEAVKAASGVQDIGTGFADNTLGSLAGISGGFAPMAEDQLDPGLQEAIQSEFGAAAKQVPTETVSQPVVGRELPGAAQALPADMLQATLPEVQPVVAKPAVAPTTTVPQVAPAVTPPGKEEVQETGFKGQEVPGSGVFDETGKLVGTIDEEGKSVGLPGAYDIGKGALKGALKGGLFAGLPGMLFGGALGGYGATGFGAPQSKFEKETADFSDVIGGKSGTKGYAKNIVSQVNALNLGKAPKGYSYGWSPMGQGVALVSDNAPEHIKIAASGPGVLGAMGLANKTGYTGPTSMSGLASSIFGGGTKGSGGGSFTKAASENKTTGTGGLY